MVPFWHSGVSMGSFMFQRQMAERKKVLVVDDHGQCRDISARLLLHLGYDVVVAKDEVEAEETLICNDGQIAAVVLDLCLTPSGDVGFARRLEEERPHLPLLFMSGYCKEVVLALGLMAPERQFLEKPFSITQLERAMACLLPGATQSGAAHVDGV
jgi:DNA-binding NtrC family response regulator